MRHFVLLYDYVPNIVERRAPHRPAHLELYRSWRADGRLVKGGAIGDPPHGAVIEFSVEDASAVEQFVSLDPYVAEGLVTAWRIEPWAVVD
jgi:uncharacterized protein